jgi:hypothetical protein
MSIQTFRCDDKGMVSSVSGNVPIVHGHNWTREWNVESSLDKGRIIGQMHNLFIGKDQEHDFLGQRAELVLDEMLENALYSAPRDSIGKPLYAKGCERTTRPDEKISLRSGFDGEQLFLEVSDSWGNLTPEIVESFLTMNLSDTHQESDRAGRGLFIMWKYLDYFYVDINPGAQTSMGGILSLHT